MVTLRPLREDEYAAWDETHRAEYERELVEFAGLDSDAARAKVEHDIPAVLPDGLASADTWIWMVESDGRPIGSVFLGLRGGAAWLYDIFIDPGERGQGYGRAAMIALEDELRRLGHGTVKLNVWGGNAIARGLYSSLGYVEESVHMRKRL
jgi:GNAT superfamily N-acetyltransferase